MESASQMTLKAANAKRVLLENFVIPANPAFSDSQIVHVSLFNYVIKTILLFSFYSV